MNDCNKINLSLSELVMFFPATTGQTPTGGLAFVIPLTIVIQVYGVQWALPACKAAAAHASHPLSWIPETLTSHSPAVSASDGFVILSEPARDLSCAPWRPTPAIQTRFSSIQNISRRKPTANPGVPQQLSYLTLLTTSISRLTTNEMRSIPPHLYLHRLRSAERSQRHQDSVEAMLPQLESRRRRPGHLDEDPGSPTTTRSGGSANPASTPSPPNTSPAPLTSTPQTQVGHWAHRRVFSDYLEIERQVVAEAEQRCYDRLFKRSRFQAKKWAPR